MKVYYLSILFLNSCIGGLSLLYGFDDGKYGLLYGDAVITPNAFKLDLVES